MPLTALIRKNGLIGLMTATVATIATHKAFETATVAPVATVAVAAPSEPISAMTQDEESAIRALAAHMNETKQSQINFVLNKCRENLEDRQFFLKLAKEVPEKPFIFNSISCGDCTHFERIEHPHLGHCKKGQIESAAGLWDDDTHICDYYSPLLNQIGEHHV
jgi:hypothetical protein